jgi:MFS family permease
MFIDLLGFGIVLPLLPIYAEQLLEPAFPEWSWGPLLGLLLCSFSLMQFLVAPIWGRLSDQKGRRPFLLLGLLGSVFGYMLFGFASGWGILDGHQVWGFILLLIARIGGGIAGATVSTAQAVIADCTTPEKRRHGMALIGAAFGLGFTCGPALAALCQIVAENNHSLPGYVAAAFSLAALVLAFCIMPETRRPGVGAGRRQWFSLDSVRLALQTPTVGALMLIFFLSTLSFGNFETTLPVALKDVLRMQNKNTSWWIAYVGFVLLLAQGGLYQTLARRGVQELSFMSVGIRLMLLAFLGLGATSFWANWIWEVHQKLVGILFLFSATVAVVGFALVTPSVQSLVSRRSDPARQGEILGVNQSANAMSRILGPVFGYALYFVPPAHVLQYAFAVILLAVIMALLPRVRHA